MSNGVSVMSGYRDKSSFDPYAGAPGGRPTRPFNGVQWTGVALVVLALAIDALYFAGRIGGPQLRWATPTLGFAPLILGVTLVNSRRDPATDLAPELAADRRRWLLIISILCVAILGAAAIIEFTRS